MINIKHQIADEGTLQHIITRSAAIDETETSTHGLLNNFDLLSPVVNIPRLEWFGSPPFSNIPQPYSHAGTSLFFCFNDGHGKFHPL